MDLPTSPEPTSGMPPPQADAAAAPSLSGAARAIGWLAAIVAILLLGSLFWSALGAFASSWRDARAALPVLNSRATATRVLAPSTLVPVASGSTEGPRTTASPALLGPPELTDATPLPTNATATRAPQLSATPTPVPSPTADATPTAVPTAPSGRLPWVLLPRPEPGSRVSAGQTTLEARGRGEADVVDIRLELDGVRVPATLDQRSDTIWRAQAGVTLSPGQHRARAVVVDAAGRTGAYAWSFDAQ